MRLVCVLLFVFGLCAEETSKLPSTAQRLVDRHDHALAELRERYLADVADLREDVTHDLERELKKTTRRGDLEGALAIKEKITALKEQEEAIAEAPTDFLGRKRQPEFVGNTYRYSSWWVRFDKDGSVKTNWTSRDLRDGEWRMEGEEIVLEFNGEEHVNRAFINEDGDLDFNGAQLFRLEEKDEDE